MKSNYIFTCFIILWLDMILYSFCNKDTMSQTLSNPDIIPSPNSVAIISWDDITDDDLKVVVIKAQAVDSNGVSIDSSYYTQYFFKESDDYITNALLQKCIGVLKLDFPAGLYKLQAYSIDYNNNNSGMSYPYFFQVVDTVASGIVWNNASVIINIDSIDNIQIIPTQSMLDSLKIIVSGDTLLNGLMIKDLKEVLQ